jgi:hypothetical protein
MPALAVWQRLDGDVRSLAQLDQVAKLSAHDLVAGRSPKFPEVTTHSNRPWKAIEPGMIF